MRNARERITRSKETLRQLKRNLHDCYREFIAKPTPTNERMLCSAVEAVRRQHDDVIEAIHAAGRSS